MVCGREATRFCGGWWRVYHVVCAHGHGWWDGPDRGGGPVCSMARGEGSAVWYEVKKGARPEAEWVWAGSGPRARLGATGDHMRSGHAEMQTRRLGGLGGPRRRRVLGYHQQAEEEEDAMMSVKKAFRMCYLCGLQWFACGHVGGGSALCVARTMGESCTKRIIGKTRLSSCQLVSRELSRLKRGSKFEHENPHTKST